MGRYLLAPEVFDTLEHQETGAGGEIQLTDAIQTLNQSQTVYVCDFEGKRHDVGEKIGYVKTTIDFALQHEGLRDDMFKIMEQSVQRQHVINIK